MDIKAILKDWNNGFTHKQILEKHQLDYSTEYAITNCYKGLTIEEIYKKIKLLKPNMKSYEIEKIMSSNVLKKFLLLILSNIYVKMSIIKIKEYVYGTIIKIRR